MVFRFSCYTRIVTLWSPNSGLTKNITFTYFIIKACMMKLCVLLRNLKNGHFQLKIFMPFCFLVAEVTILFKAHPTMMELSVKIVVFWHNLQLLIHSQGIYVPMKNNKTSAFLHLLDYLLLLWFTCLTWRNSKFIDLHYCSKCSQVKVLRKYHPKKSVTLLMADNKIGLYLDTFFWFCPCSTFQT